VLKKNNFNNLGTKSKVKLIPWTDSVLHYFSYVFNIKLSYQTEHIEIDDSRDDRVVKETSSARRKSIQPNSWDQVLVENWIFIDSTRNYKSNWATCLGTAEKLQMKSLPVPEVRVRQWASFFDCEFESAGWLVDMFNLFVQERKCTERNLRTEACWYQSE